MLRPSYSELMEILNNESDVDSQITSRYTIVIAAAKRARQLVEGARPLSAGSLDHVVSLAVKEMEEGYLKIKLDKDLADIYKEHRSRNYYKSFSAVSKDDLREDFKDKYEPIGIEDDDDLEDDMDEDYGGEEYAEADEEEDYTLEDEEDEPAYGEAEAYDEES